MPWHAVPQRCPKHVFKMDDVRTDLHHLQQQQPVELLDGLASGDAFAANAYGCARQATLTRCHREAVQLILAPCILSRCRATCHTYNKSHNLLHRRWLPLSRLPACLVRWSTVGTTTWAPSCHTLAASKLGRDHPHPNPVY